MSETTKPLPEKVMQAIRLCHVGSGCAHWPEEDCPETKALRAVREALDEARNESKVCVCHIPSPDPCPRHPDDEAV